jgi:hypothetical protein
MQTLTLCAKAFPRNPGGAARQVVRSFTSLVSADPGTLPALRAAHAITAVITLLQALGPFCHTTSEHALWWATAEHLAGTAVLRRWQPLALWHGHHCRHRCPMIKPCKRS